MLASARLRSTESKFRLLYLGSDLELVAALREALTEADYRLVSCSDRESAILFLQSEIPYQLLLIDLEWRGREGLKLARLARSLPHRKQMRIVVLADHVETRARKRGVDEWILKSEMREMVEAIRRLMSRRPEVRGQKSEIAKQRSVELLPAELPPAEFLSGFDDAEDRSSCGE